MSAGRPYVDLKAELTLRGDRLWSCWVELMRIQSKDVMPHDELCFLSLHT